MIPSQDNLPGVPPIYLTTSIHSSHFIAFRSHSLPTPMATLTSFAVLALVSYSAGDWSFRPLQDGSPFSSINHFNGYQPRPASPFEETKYPQSVIIKDPDLALVPVIQRPAVPPKETSLQPVVPSGSQQAAMKPDVHPQIMIKEPGFTTQTMIHKPEITFHRPMFQSKPPFGFKPDRWYGHMMAYLKPPSVSMEIAQNSKPLPPIVGLLKQLMQGKYHIVADAIRLDATPIQTQQRPFGKPMEEIFAMPLVIGGSRDDIVSNGVSSLETSNPIHTNPKLPTGQVSTVPQVPLEVLLNEFKDLEAKHDEHYNQHKVTFSSLYNNYMKLLGQRTTLSPPTSPAPNEIETTTVTTTDQPSTAETTTSSPVENTTTESTSTTKPSEQAPSDNMIDTPKDKGTDDNVLWLPGMGPDM